MLAFATSLVHIKVYFSLCVGGFKKLIDAPREIADLVRNDGSKGEVMLFPIEETFLREML